MATLLLAGACAGGAQTPLFAASFQLGVNEDGIYRVSFAELSAAGLDGPVASATLSLSSGGRAVPMVIDDGGDGYFGPGDSLDFEGLHPAGQNSYLSEYTRWNVYRLGTGSSDETRAAQPNGPEVVPVPGAGAASGFWRRERDRVRVRFNELLAPEQAEIWYWQRLSVLDKEPFPLPLPLAELAAQTDLIDIRISLRGWSTPGEDADTGDHVVEILAADRVVGRGRWNGQAENVLELRGWPVSRTGPELALRVPRRPSSKGGGNVIDVSLLNWVEVSFPYRGRVGQRQVDLRTSLAGPVTIPDGATLYVAGQRFAGPAQVPVPAGRWWVVPAQALRSPAWVRQDRPSRLTAKTNQADYLMIAHPSLMEASQPLAEFHRRRGLSVALVDVQDIYDEFSHGVVTPLAIRDFVRHTVEHWEGPSPRFVLLVGDASWDAKNEQPLDRLYADWTYRPGENARFVKNRSTAYPEFRSRALIPTFPALTYEGPAANDNAFVATSAESFKPTLAIGRLPVVTPQELSAVVDKIIRYSEPAQYGPWRRDTLWITNEERSFQQSSDTLVSLAVPEGFGADRIYPKHGDADNARYQQLIIDALDKGSALVHFLGHGGRYIWRTGPPDPRKNHDLFTLDHLEQLRPSRQLPVVLSMTCYSAPFDHPTADSIGEKFLRMPQRGAIAVFAASWRNFPEATFSRDLVKELLQPGSTMGEAIMAVKQRTGNRLLVETYNLLGDPALPLAVPAGRVNLRLRGDKVMGSVVDGPATGSAILDYVDARGRVLATEQADVAAGKFERVIPRALIGQKLTIRAYVWNAAANYDGVGSLEISS